MRKFVTAILVLLMILPYLTVFADLDTDNYRVNALNDSAYENESLKNNSDFVDMLEVLPLNGIPSSVEVLPIHLDEIVRIQENGTSELEILVEIPSSPLADIYRRSFGFLHDANLEDQTVVSKTIGVNTEETDENAMQIVIPGTLEEFQDSIAQQQQISLGLVTEILDCELMPRTSNDGFRISMKASAAPPEIDVAIVESGFKWGFFLGSNNKAIRSVFATLELTQLMLASLPNEQAYECLWSTKIVLPCDAQLVNGDEINGQSWMIDFGGGTTMNAWVSLFDDSTLVLTEKTKVTEQEMTTTPECTYLTDYKKLDIVILSSHPPLQSPNDWRIAWDYTWSETWADSQTFSFSYGPLDATLTVSASITISGYVGWDLDLFSGVTRFESWMNLIASVDVDFEAVATAYYDHTWEQTFFDWSIHFDAFALGLPVWADLTLTATGVLSVSAYGQLTVTAGASASATFTAGVKWTPTYNWESIFDVSSSASYYGPTIDAEAGVWVRPSVRFRIAFLFYSIAGPYVEFEPYAILTLTCYYPPPHGDWSISAYLRITAGATFVGWLKDLLGLDDYSVILTNPDIVLASWSGSWGTTSMDITEYLDPSTTTTSSSVRVYGDVTLNDGSPVSYAIVLITITQTGASWTTSTDSNGDYSAYISAPETSGSYTVRVEVSTGSLSDSTSKTLNVQNTPGSEDNYELCGITTCKNVQSNDPWDPIDETYVFRRDDTIAYTWIKLCDVYVELNVRFEWYTPDGSFYTSGINNLPAPPSGQYWSWYKTSRGIWISGYSPEDMEGRWLCKVSIDEGGGYEHVATVEFVIGYEIVSAWIVIAEDVQSSSPYEPINPTDDFLNTDPQALGWIRLDEVAESLDVKWEWRYPIGSVDFESLHTSLDPADEGYLYYTWYKFWAWRTISGTPRQSMIGTWNLRVYIKDVYGNWDQEFSTNFFISDNTPPGPPGTPIDEGDYSIDGTLTWTWTAAEEDWYVDQYQVQIGTTPGGNSVFNGYTDSPGITLDDLPGGQTYYARVRAMNTVNQWSAWSGNSNGITVDKPPMVLITQGANGSIDYNDVRFQWSGYDDITSSANLEYNYALYAPLEIPSWSGWVSDTSHQYNDLPDSDFMFEVRVRDQRNTEDPTPATNSFTVAVEYEVTFFTDPAGVDYSIMFEGETYFDGDVDTFPHGTGVISANAPEGWMFDRWEVTDGVSVYDINSEPTLANISDHGSIKAIYTIVSTSICVDPQTAELGIGEDFILRINITDVEDLCGFDIQLSWNNTILDYASHTMTVPVETYPNGVLYGPILIVKDEVNEISGSYWVAVACLPPASSFNGSGFVVEMTFQAKAKGTCVLDIFSSDLADSSSDAIPHIAFDGVVDVIEVHDIAITDILVTKTIVGRGLCTQLNATVTNQGNFIETFDVHLYANMTLIGTQSVNSLTSGASIVLTFVWNTTDFTEGDYVIHANAEPVPGEIDIMDNGLTASMTIRITILGDVDGDLDVDIFDIVTIAGAYGSHEGDSEYNEVYDLDEDGDIDIFDIVLAIKNYGVSL